MSLSDKLAARAREGSAGSIAFRGFDYQHHWTLCALIELHEAGDDYVLMVDHHDDVIVWESPPAGKLRCYQLKAKGRGNWTVGGMTKKAAGSSLSILGKLYHHVIVFDGEVTGVQFVSNARYSVGTLRDGSDSRSRVLIECTELSDAKTGEIRDALKAEHRLSADPPFEPMMSLKSDPMPVEGRREYTLGRITDVLDRIAGGGSVPAKAAYTALMGEVARRATLVADSLPPAEALARKSLKRDEVAIMIAEMLRAPSRDQWSEIQQVMQSKGVPAARILRLRRTARALEAKRMSAEWGFVSGLVEQAREAIASLDDDTEDSECEAVGLRALAGVERSNQLTSAELEAIVLEAIYGA